MNNLKYEILIKLRQFIYFLDDRAWFLKIKITKYATHLIKTAKVHNKTYKDIILGADYQEKKLALIQGLDEKSAEVVNLTSRRIRNFLKQKKRLHSQRFDEFLELKKADIYKKFATKKSGENYKIGKYVLPREYYDNQIFWDKYFINEFENLSSIKEKDIIDVGAFIGDSSILFEQYTDKIVRAFEPVESNFIDMLKTIQLNSSEKIVPYKFGLGSKEQELMINKFDSTGVSSTLRADMVNYKNNVQEKILIKTLDDVAREENLKIGLIKVDVEGAEQDFLQGAIETIKTQKPAMLIAIYHTGEDFFEIKPWLESLNLGYKFKIRKAAKPKVLDDIVLICEVR